MLKSKNIFYLATVVFFLLITGYLFPLSDDWYYTTSPNICPSLIQLLPTKTFWRPFDCIIGFILGFYPYLFPLFNRVCVCLTHVISVAFLEKLLKHLNFKHWIIKFCVLYAMFSSATLATIVSPDGLNQAFSLMFGLIGMYLYFKNSDICKYIICCAISVLWKESGIVWIFVIPFLKISLPLNNIKEIWLKKEVRGSILKTVVTSLLFVIVYFSIRFLLSGSIQLGTADSRYALSIFSLSLIKNLVNIFANSMMGLDTIALFTDSPLNILFLTTLFLSLIFLLFITYLIVDIILKRKKLIGFIALIITSLMVAIPHLVIGSAGEMHSYPTIFCVVLIYGYLLEQKEHINKKILVSCILCIFISFAITGIDKITTLYDYSKRTQKITAEMLTHYDNPEDKLLVISVAQYKGYSVFTQSAIEGAHYGYSMKPYYGWRNLDIKYVKAKDEKEAKQIFEKSAKQYDKIWFAFNDRVEFIK